MFILPYIHRVLSFCAGKSANKTLCANNIIKSPTLKQLLLWAKVSLTLFEKNLTATRSWFWHCVLELQSPYCFFFNHFAKCASNVTLFNMGQHWCLPGYRSTWSSAGFVHSDWLIILLPVWALVTDQLVQNMAETPDCQSSAGNWPAGINRADYCSCQTNTGNWPVGKKIADYPGCRFSASNWPVGKNSSD